MKNKLIYAGVALLSLFALTSCTNGGESENYNDTRSDNPIDDSIKTELGIFAESDSKLVGTDSGNGSRYVIHAKNDTVSSLFRYRYDLTSYFGSEDTLLGKNNRTITVSTLSFTKIFDTEKTEFLSQVYGTTGFTTVLSDLPFTVDTEASYTKTYSTTEAYKQYEENHHNVYLEIVYLPLLLEHYYSSQLAFKGYVFLPIYTTFVMDSVDGNELKGSELVESTIKGIRVANIENYLSTFGFLKTTVA